MYEGKYAKSHGPYIEIRLSFVEKKLPGTRFQLEQATPLGSKNAISCLEDWLVMAFLRHL